MSKLYIVPTPIGNMQDITLRALEVLKSVDFVIAEDTRTAGNLLKHFGISKPLFSFHLHNEHKTVVSLAARIRGSSAALVSDAGTPGISDPGFLLVRECLLQDIAIETLPGATAFVPALVNSGFPCDRFYFHGFLPHKKGRMKELEQMKASGFTSILYESPHRIMKTLEQLTEVYGSEHLISISRELTKVFEETARGTVVSLIEHFQTHPLKGEFVIVVSPYREERTKTKRTRL